MYHFQTFYVYFTDITKATILRFTIFQKSLPQNVIIQNNPIP